MKAKHNEIENSSLSLCCAVLYCGIKSLHIVLSNHLIVRLLTLASAFSDSLMASWGLFHPPTKISGTTKGMTMKFLLDVGIHKETQNQKKFGHN